MRQVCQQAAVHAAQSARRVPHAVPRHSAGPDLLYREPLPRAQVKGNHGLSHSQVTNTVLLWKWSFNFWYILNTDVIFDL